MFCPHDLEKTGSQQQSCLRANKKYLLSLYSSSNGPDTLADLSASSPSALGMLGSGLKGAVQWTTGPNCSWNTGMSPKCGSPKTCFHGRDGMCTSGGAAWCESPVLCAWRLHSQGELLRAMTIRKMEGTMQSNSEDDVAQGVVYTAPKSWRYQNAVSIISTTILANLSVWLLSLIKMVQMVGLLSLL